ncbi:unnamed protein product, partial [Symbiodinium sp. KB8]
SWLGGRIFFRTSMELRSALSQKASSGRTSSSRRSYLAQWWTSAKPVRQRGIASKFVMRLTPMLRL